jgi:hypothetical protein
MHMVDVRDQLETIQRALGDFAAAGRQGLVGIPIRQPRFGGKQSQELLKAPGYLNKHLCI